MDEQAPHIDKSELEKAIIELKKFDLSDPVNVSNKKRDAARRKKRDEEFMRRMLADAAGRAWFWRLLESCHCFSTSFVQGDASASAFKEGERNIGLRVLSDIMRADAQSYLLMTKENSD